MKRFLCLTLMWALTLPLPALGAEEAPAKTYEQAVAELRNSGHYNSSSEQIYETDDCTIFIYDNGGVMRPPHNRIAIIYKAGSLPGEGVEVYSECPYGLMLYHGPNRLALSEDRRTLTYAFVLEEDVDAASLKAGIYTYTVDLPTGTTTPSYAPITYEGLADVLAQGADHTLEERLDGPCGSAVLRWSNCVSPDEQGNPLRDYELYLVSKGGDPIARRLILPSTVNTNTTYSPTHIPPDSMSFSEDGKILTYVYIFDSPLMRGDTQLHDAGTYTYTVDTATGELKVNHTPLPSSPADPVFSDVPAGSWFTSAVEICAREGIMVGTSADTFSPDGILTDAECLTLGWRLYDQARGGDGSVPKAPEDWGAIALKTDNGLVDVSGYLGEDRWLRFQYYDWDEDANYYHLSLHLGMSEELAETYAPCGTRQEPTEATLIFEGVEHRGQIYLNRRGVASGRPPDCSLVFLTEDEELNQALLNSIEFAVMPGQWWRDLSWAIQQESGGSGRWDYDRFPLHPCDNISCRAGFAQVLAAVTDLPKRYDVPQIPEFARDEEKEYAYRLYEAGILGGVDEYGTFQEYKSLTRAEAATMVARVLDESLRLTRAPRPMPQEGVDYTLTYLMEGEGDGWREHSYPLYHVMETDKEGWLHSLGMLTLDGRLVPWPEGWEGEFQYFTSQGETMSITLRDATGADRQSMHGIMDRNGNWRVEPGRYAWVSPLAQGGFYGPGPWDESLGTYAWYDILDGDGHPIDRVERFEALEELPDTGEDTWENWGGLTLPGSWYSGCLYYSRPDGTPATNWLDSAGRIGPDGKGFVEKDGKIYRIAFPVQNEEK